MHSTVWLVTFFWAGWYSDHTNRNLVKGWNWKGHHHTPRGHRFCGPLPDQFVSWRLFCPAQETTSSITATTSTSSSITSTSTSATVSCEFFLFGWALVLNMQKIGPAPEKGETGTRFVRPSVWEECQQNCLRLPQAPWASQAVPQRAAQQPLWDPWVLETMGRQSETSRFSGTNNLYVLDCYLCIYVCIRDLCMY